MARLLRSHSPAPRGLLEWTLVQDAADNNAIRLDQISDLRQRWVLARVAAARAFVPQGTMGDEHILALLACAANPDGALKKVFEHSFTLGQGFSRWTGLDLCLSDVSTLLPGLGAPCSAVPWVATAPGVRCGEREACADASPHWCQWWREATLGLVNGLSSSVWYSRVLSPGTGGPRCRDVLHVDPWSAERFLPLDAEDARRCDEALRPLREAGTRVDILGGAEGVLYVRAEGSSAEQALATVAACIPHLSVRSCSPRSVLSSSDAGSSCSGKSTSGSVPCPTRTTRLPVLASADVSSCSPSSG